MQSEPAGTSSSAASMSSAGRMKLLQALADVPLSLCRAESDDEDEERLDDTEAEVEEDEAKSYRANAIATLQTLYGSDARRADDDEDDGAARKQEQGHSRHDEPAKSRQQARLESRAHELVILARLTGQSALHPRIIGRDTAGPRASTHSSSEQPGSMGSEAPAASMEPLARQCLSQLLSSVEADGIREGEEREDAVASLAIYALRTHIRQAFSNKPTSSSTASATPSQHPRVSSTTGRAMQRPTGGGALAGGNVSMNDVNSPQATWRSSPAIDVVLSELLRILPDSTIRHRETTAQAGESTADAAAPASNTGEQEHQRRCQRKRREVLDQAWPAVIPPLATLLDDHDARAKLAGARALDVLLDKVDGEILERTGIGQLFFNSLLVNCAQLDWPLSARLLAETTRVCGRLINVRYPASAAVARSPPLPSAKAKAKAGQAAARRPSPADQRREALFTLFDATVSRVYAYKQGNVVLERAVAREILPSLSRELGISTVRYLQLVIPHLATLFESAPLPSSTSLGASELIVEACYALVVLAQVCRPRMERWSVEILTGIAKCWVRLGEDADKDTSSESKHQIEDALRGVIMELANTQSIRDIKLSELRAVDSVLHPLVDTCLASA